jgi:hypothetical protein
VLTDEQLVERLQDALDSETAEIDLPPNLLASVHDQLLRAPGTPERRWWKPTLGGVFTGLAAAVAVAVAVIAVVVIKHDHTPVQRPSASPVSPDPLTAVVEAGDPRGGPPWELRTSESTRGGVCLRVARVRASPRTPVHSCTAPDARGHAFLNVFVREVPATTTFGGRYGRCRTAPGPKPTAACPLKDFRNLAYGLLGPEAVSITYVSFDGRSVTRRTQGRDGAYLVVLPATPWSCTFLKNGGRQCNGGNGEEAPTGALQSGVITAVTYRDGHICRLPTPTSSGVTQASCPPVGYAAPQTPPFRPPHVTPAEVAAPVTARALPAKRYCYRPTTPFAIPCDHGIPHGYNRGVLVTRPRQVLIQVSFTARLAATNTHSVYEWTMSNPPDPGCPGGGGGRTATTMSPIRAGQHVVLQAFEGCPGRYTGLVTYQPNGWPGHDTLGPEIRDGSILVGRFSFVVR